MANEADKIKAEIIKRQMSEFVRANTKQLALVLKTLLKAEKVHSRDELEKEYTKKEAKLKERAKSALLESDENADFSRLRQEHKDSMDFGGFKGGIARKSDFVSNKNLKNNGSFEIDKKLENELEKAFAKKAEEKKAAQKKSNNDFNQSHKTPRGWSFEG